MRVAAKANSFQTSICSNLQTISDLKSIAVYKQFSISVNKGTAA